MHTRGDTNKRHEIANNSEANYDAPDHAHQGRNDFANKLINNAHHGGKDRTDGTGQVDSTSSDLVFILLNEQKKKKRYWGHPILKKREESGECVSDVSHVCV